MRGHDVHIVCRRLWLQGVKAAVFFIAAIITEFVCGCVNMRVYIHCVCGCGYGCGYVGVGVSCYISIVSVSLRAGEIYVCLWV